MKWQSFRKVSDRNSSTVCSGYLKRNLNSGSWNGLPAYGSERDCIIQMCAIADNGVVQQRRAYLDTETLLAGQHGIGERLY